jgi:uncharacterized repeat protein (TIGR01451 family)
MKRTINVHLVLALGLGLTLALLWLLSNVTPLLTTRAADLPHPASAPGDVLCVALEGGGPYPGCTQVFTNVQAAVDAASGGEIIKVAQGVYTGVSARPTDLWYLSSIVTQVVYIDKSVNIQGGYTTTDWTTPYPLTQPVTLDARGRGRVACIAGSIYAYKNTNITIEGVQMTGGNAGLSGYYLDDAGGGIYVGGVYVDNITVVLVNNQVFSNTASNGGGIYVIAATATLSNNQLFSNTADYGGGVQVRQSTTALNSNTIFSNTVKWCGGGVFVYNGTATLDINTIASNLSEMNGGGLALWGGSVTLNENTVTSNTASVEGGGLELWGGDITLNENTVTANVAAVGGGLYLTQSNAKFNKNIVTDNLATNSGGGLYLYYSLAEINRNTISANTASNDGGGLCLLQSPAVLDGNNIVTNTASQGGGMHLWEGSDATLNNNSVVDNWASGQGSDISIDRSSPRLLHTTIAHNAGGSGDGVYITALETVHTVTLTNTILAGQMVGVYATANNTITINGILWFDNRTNIGGEGFITVTSEITGNPLFTADSYHLMAGSAAIDTGEDAGTATDIDGDPRPMGHGYDLGADEFPVRLSVSKQANRDNVQPGEQVTYTLDVTNTGDIDLHAVITDTLPTHVTSGKTSGGTTLLPGQPFTWTAFIPTSSIWTETVIVTVETGYSGSLTNVVEVTTAEGATGTGSITVNTVSCKVYLPLVLRQP